MLYPLPLIPLHSHFFLNFFIYQRRIHNSHGTETCRSQYVKPRKLIIRLANHFPLADSTPSTPTGPTEPAPSTNSPAPSARGAPRTIATPGIMLGTITIPDGQAPPDINQV